MRWISLVSRSSPCSTVRVLRRFAARRSLLSRTTSRFKLPYDFMRHARYWPYAATLAASGDESESEVDDVDRYEKTASR